jgi:hypothetical protein
VAADAAVIAAASAADAAAVIAAATGAGAAVIAVETVAGSEVIAGPTVGRIAAPNAPAAASSAAAAAAIARIKPSPLPHCFSSKRNRQEAWREGGVTTREIDRRAAMLACFSFGGAVLGAMG